MEDYLERKNKKSNLRKTAYKVAKDKVSAEDMRNKAMKLLAKTTKRAGAPASRLG